MRPRNQKIVFFVSERGKLDYTKNKSQKFTFSKRDSPKRITIQILSDKTFETKTFI